MSCCSESGCAETGIVADVPGSSTADTAGHGGLPGVTDRLVVEVDAHDGLVNLERIVGLLRGRRHPVAGVSADLRGDRAVIAVWGVDLHEGDDDALVLLRLRRLPGVLGARIDPTPTSAGAGSLNRGSAGTPAAPAVLPAPVCESGGSIRYGWPEVVGGG